MDQMTIHFVRVLAVKKMLNEVVSFKILQTIFTTVSLIDRQAKDFERQDRVEDLFAQTE